MKIRLRNPRRESSRGTARRYRADLEVDGKVVGRVERGWSMGGRGAGEYVAEVNGFTVASGHTLRDLREELAEVARLSPEDLVRDGWNELDGTDAGKG